MLNQVPDSPGVTFSFELRQRNVNGGVGEADVADEDVNAGFKREAQDVNVGFKGLQKDKSLDWNQVIRENTAYLHGKFLILLSILLVGLILSITRYGF